MTYYRLCIILLLKRDQANLLCREVSVLPAHYNTLVYLFSNGNVEALVPDADTPRSLYNLLFLVLCLI